MPKQTVTVNPKPRSPYTGQVQEPSDWKDTGKPYVPTGTPAKLIPPTAPPTALQQIQKGAARIGRIPAQIGKALKDTVDTLEGRGPEDRYRARNAPRMLSPTNPPVAKLGPGDKNPHDMKGQERDDFFFGTPRKGPSKKGGK